MSSQRMKKKRTKIKIVLCICTSDKNWEGKNVKFHINYRYKSNLYALFTCFVFRYYIVRHSISKWTLAQNSTYISPSTPYSIFFTERFVYVARSFHIHNSFSLQLSPCDFSIFFHPLSRRSPHHDLHHFLPYMRAIFCIVAVVFGFP